jgi:hypothetical protein
VSEDSRRIPWAPRVALDDAEVVVFAALAAQDEEACSVAISLAFQIENFRLASDGDVLWRWENITPPPPRILSPHRTLQDAQLGRGVIVCGVEGQTRYGKPVFNCSLDVRFHAAQLLAAPALTPAGAQGGACSVRTEGACDESGAAATEELLSLLPAGRLRLQAKFLAQQAGRLRPAAAYANANGPRGPPSAVLSDSAVPQLCLKG